jgi:hypothetical protein
MRLRSKGETNPDVCGFVAEAIERLERVADRPAGGSADGGAAQPEGREAGAKATRSD